MFKGVISETKSINKVVIRLTFERWYHISENHQELTGLSYEVLEVVNQPDMIVEGSNGEFLAVKKISRKYLVSAYKEIDKKMVL